MRESIILLDAQTNVREEQVKEYFEVQPRVNFIGMG